MAATKTKPAERSSIEEATAEAHEASALVEALEERIRTGDDSVTAEELEKAQRLAAFSEMLVDGAKHRAHQAQIEAATKSLTQSAKELVNVVTSDKQLVDTRTKLIEALIAYLSACDGHGARVTEANKKFSESRLAASSLAIDTSFESLGVEVANGAVVIPRKDDGARLIHRLQDLYETTEQVRLALDPAGLTLRGQIERAPGGNQ